MPYEVIRIVEGQLVRTVDGEEVERRTATAHERRIPDPDAPDPQAVAAGVLREQLTDVLQSNRAFVALTPPTQAQVVVQVKALSVQINKIIRLVIGQLDATD